jgi:hypothetical protein
MQSEDIERILKMKASELIAELNGLAKDDDPEVVISIRSYYKSYTLSFEPITQLDRYTGDEVRIQTSLGEGFIVREKKSK